MKPDRLIQPEPEPPREAGLVAQEGLDEAQRVLAVVRATGGGYAEAIKLLADGGCARSALVALGAEWLKAAGRGEFEERSKWPYLDQGLWHARLDDWRLEGEEGENKTERLVYGGGPLKGVREAIGWMAAEVERGFADDCFRSATGMEIHGSFFWQGGGTLGCLTGLPENFHVHGDLCFANVQCAQELPKGLVVGRTARFHCLDELKALPEGLLVGQDLDLQGCFRLKRLPDGLHVPGDLLLDGCSSLEALPDGLRVDGILRLRHCTQLKRIGKGLVVGEGLDLDFGSSSEWDGVIPEDAEIGRIFGGKKASGEDYAVQWATRGPGRPRAEGGISLADWRAKKAENPHWDVW